MIKSLDALAWFTSNQKRLYLSILYQNGIFNCITWTRQPQASNLTRLSFNTQWWKLTMKPWETDAFSIMQGFFFFFFSLKTCLPRPRLLPQGKGLNHSVKEKSYFTVFLMVISSNLKSFMSLSSMLLREAELEQIQTVLSHSQISCNWKCQGDKGSCHVRIHCSGWKDLTLLIILMVPVLFHRWHTQIR